MAELPPSYPSSPLTNESLKTDQNRKEKKGKERKTQRSLPAAAAPRTLVSLCACSIPPFIHLGGNFPTSVAARKSITAWSHSSLENSSETCTCRHLPTFQPVAFPTAFHSVFCWSLHRLQWRKRCSRVWAAVLPPPPHHQHLSSSRWLNRFR